MEIQVVLRGKSNSSVNLNLLLTIRLSHILKTMGFKLDGVYNART